MSLLLIISDLLPNYDHRSALRYMRLWRLDCPVEIASMADAAKWCQISPLPYNIAVEMT